jgi:hypothetical protein
MKKEKIFPFMDYEFERFKKGLRGEEKFPCEFGKEFGGDLRGTQPGILEKRKGKRVSPFVTW